MENKKNLSFKQFMKIQTRWIIFYCNITGMDYVHAAEKYGAALRQKLESKYIINF